jgi:heme exporter protein C
MEQRIISSARVTGPLALLAALAWMYAVWLVAPAAEAVQGVAYKIIYLHVPCWPAAYLGFGITAFGGVMYLVTRREEWDRLAHASAEVGVLFCSLGLVTGMLWARPIWGVWWNWEPRLTLSMVLWFIYLAYLFLRAFSEGSDRARVFSAVYGSVAVAAIPFVYFALRELHPPMPEMPRAMGSVLLGSMVTYLVVFVYLLGERLGLSRAEAEQTA